jgi:hypothetical protein
MNGVHYWKTPKIIYKVIKLAPVERIELPQADLEAAVLPLYYTGINLAPQAGHDPATNRLTVCYSTN